MNRGQLIHAIRKAKEAAESDLNCLAHDSKSSDDPDFARLIAKTEAPMWAQASAMVHGYGSLLGIVRADGRLVDELLLLDAQLADPTGGLGLLPDWEPDGDPGQSDQARANLRTAFLDLVGRLFDQHTRSRGRKGEALTPGR